MNATIEKNELALLPQITALQLFTDGGVRSILDKIKGEVLSVVTDPTTEKGRKEIASLAHKVARTKVAMDEMGKSLTDEQRKFIESINAERRVIVTELDELKDQVRRPLTEYENREKERVAAHEKALAGICNAVELALASRDSLAIEEAVFELEKLDVSGFQEFTSRAETEKAAGLHRLKKLSDELHAEKVERQRIEKERAEAEAKERAEREAKIAAEAAEKARAEAEAEAARLAAIEQARVETEVRKAEEAREAERKAEAARLAAIEAEKVRVEREAKEATERAERERVAAEERHQRELREAKEENERQERNRLAAIEAERVAEEKRAANVKHRAKVMKDAMEALAMNGVPAQFAESVVILIASGKIPNITIQF